MKDFQKVAVANRGEIAVRVLHALKEMNISSVLLHSSEDQNSLAESLADEAFCIGPAPAQDSYLNIPAVIEGAKSAGADALHPGIGFLSESPELAKACAENGIVFIGPSEKCLKLFGSKISALNFAKSLSVPVLPFFHYPEEKPEAFLLEQAEKIGWPLMMKLDFGGGGIGIKKISQPKEFLENFSSISRMGQSAFNSKEIFVEKYLSSARHIEVQIFGDHFGKIHHLFERDCSVQKRNQKIIESAPASLKDELKKKLFQYAVKLAESANYKNAGTVEFLIQDENIYFIEMNTRLQVEHPVTEMLLGVDFVRAQILTAMGRGAFIQTPFHPRGFSLECRIYSQDSLHRPVSGKLGSVKWAACPGVRLDMGCESGGVIPSYYDSMIGKIIAWGETRTRAVEKMLYVLKNSFVFGVPTNKEELIETLSSPEYIEDNFTLGVLPKAVKGQSLSPQETEIIERCCSQIKEQKEEGANPWVYPW